MASLRDTFSFADPGVSQQGFEELQAQNMGAVRKSYEGSRVGNVANAAAAQLASLRAEGRHAEADVIQAELEATQQRMGAYAPEVGKVENIGSAGGGLIGDGLTWVGEAVGQAAGSMQDPLLAATAMNAGGRLLGMSKHPAAQLASKALTWGAPAVGFGLNYDQSKGEFVQNAMRDPELMARTSWQDLNRTAQTHGVVSGAMDTALPALLGRQLAGKAGMAALSKMAPTSFGGRTLAAMGLEGATEFAQGKSSQFGLGHLNPDRDTTGDFSEDLNNFAGGVFGSGPTAAAGAAAEGGHQRLGGVADALGKKAGDTVDLATGAVDSAKEKGRSWWDRLTGGKEAEDLQGGDGAAPAGFKLSPEERSTLNWAKDNEKRVDEPGFDEEFQAQEAKRSEFTVAKLAELAESDDKAADILERAGNAANPTEQIRVLSEGSDYLLRKHDLDNLDQTGRSLPSKGAELAGRAAKGIVKGATKVAGDVISGAARGLAGKKNLQADEGGSASYTLADWEATQASRRSAAKQALASTGPSARKAEQTSRMNLAARQAAEFARTKYQGKEGLARMASHTAFELIDASRDFRRSDVAGTQPGARNARLGRVADTMRRLYGAEDAMKMADTIASIVGQDDNKYLTPAAEYVKAEIQRLETPAGRVQAKQERAELVSKIAATVSPQVHQKLLDNGVNLYGEHGEQFLELIEKLADGTSQPEMRHKLNGMVGSGTVAKMLDVVNESDIAKGKDEKPQKVSSMFGETADEQEILGEGFQVDDDGEVTDYEKKQGEKQVGKTSAPKLYGFKNTQATRSSADWRNPFAGATVSKAALAEWRDSVESDKVHGRAPKEDPRIEAATKRPSLFGQDDTLSDGRNAIEARIEAMKAGLGEKSASWSVGAKKAADLLKDMNMSDVARISLYRDYLRKAMKSTKATVEQKAKWKDEVGMLGLVLADLTSGKLKDSKANAADRGEEFADAGVDDTSTSGIHSLRKKRTDAQKQAMRDADDTEAREFSQQALARTMPGPTGALTNRRERAQALKRADNYFANRYLVVAEDMTNRAPEDISLAEVKSMTNTGLKAMDFARKITSETDSRIEKTGLTGAEANQLRKAAKREHDEVVDAYNILEFAPLEGDKPVYIKAGDLVYWARTQRNKSEVMTKEKASKFGRGDLDREYLDDLMTGISTILASGAVGPQMPVKRNKFGKPEAFETPQQGKNGRKPSVADSVPDSLRLVTLTAGQMRWKPETQDTRGPEWAGPPDPTAGGDARADEEYQQAVATDQERNEDFFVADPLQEMGELRTLDPQDYAALTPDERKTLNGFADRYAKAEGSTKTEIAREQREFLDGLSLRKDGKRYSTAVDTTSFERERGMTDDAERVNAENGTKLGVSGPKGGKTPAGESHRAVYKDAPKQADQIRRDRRMRNADGTKREVIEDGAEFPVEMTDDEISPLDFFPDQEPGAVPDEFADAQFRNRIEGYDPATTVSAEHKMSAAGQAKERGDALRGKLVPGRGEGRTELTTKQLEGINSIAARIRSAYRPERREEGDAGLVGGWHYLYPAAHALNTDFLSTLANGGKDPAELVDTLEFLRGQLNRALLDSSATPKQKAAIAKLMAPKASAGRINEGNIQGILEKNAPARDESLAPTEQSSKTQAAPEVAAQEAPKAQAKPSGAEDKRNAQDARTPRDTPASPEEIAQAKAWMSKVLPKVRVEFEKLTGYSGEFIEAENLVKISTTAAAGVMQTAYHEGLHAFFAGLAKNPEALRVMSSIADNRVVFRRLQALLAKYPAAKAQLVDGEERLAYAFQFWAAGKLQLPVGPARGFFAKLRKFFRQVAGLIKDEEKAADIFQAFNDGKLGDPSTAGKVLNDILAQGTWTKKGLKRLDGLMQRVRQLIMPAEEILMRAPSAEAKALARQLFTNPGDEGSAGMQEGLLNAQRTITTKEMNRFANAIAGLDDKDMANVAKLLEAKTPLNEIPYAPYLKAVKEIRQQLKDFHTYMQSSTMEMGTVKDDYFPRVWSLTKLIDDREGFVKMLMDNYPERLAEIAGAANLRNTKNGKLKDGAVEMDNKAAAEEITNYLIKRNGTDGKVATQREDGVLAPYFAAGEKREFAWIETQKSEPWQNKNLIGIMTGYLHEGVRSAEYTRRFGRKGEHLDASLRTIEAELTDHARAELAKGEFKDQKAANAWVTRQMRGIRQSVGAMEGSLGKDISDRMRKFNSWMMVYQNVRLLPLTLFASVVDPMGMIARGATMREAFEAFQRGIQEVFRGWADLFRQEPKGALSDKWTKLAEHIGAVDAAILSHHASEEYSSTYLSHGAKQINDAFFKINGMEAWNRGMRVGAVKSAAAFIARHKALPDVHSQRWLTELGLTPDQITLDGEGNLITDVQDLVDQTGVSKTEAKRQIDAIHAALNRWTLSAVLTPNAAQRPAWSSDPHYSLFFHLKQFSYSFHQTILKRAVKEMNYGNMGPIAAFAGYIPVMIASDVMKGLIVGGGELPNHMQGMDLGDWVMHGLERSGTLGIGAIGVDASQDMFSVLGPGVEQLVDGITEPIADTTLRAMPLNPLVRAMAE